MRLFVAADLPAPVRARLAAVAPGDPWRPVREESLHVTLAFLGERAEASVAGLIAALDTVSVDRAPKASLARTQLLPPRRPRVCAVVLDDPGEGLAALHADVVRALAADGLLEPEARPFLAHVTLARCRGRHAGTTVEVTGDFAIPSFSLYVSRSAPGGSRYESLRTWELSG